MTAIANPAYVAALVDARRTGHVVPRDPRREPPSTADAYAVQTAVAIAIDADVGGWKVGFGPDGTAVGAPMFAADFHPAGARIARPRSGWLLVEVELAFRLGRDLPPREHAYSRDEVLDAADAAMIGIELVAGRVGESKDVPFDVWLADNIGNLGYVVGEPAARFRDVDLRALRCRLRLGERLVHDAVGGHPQDDPVEPLRAWASAPRDGLGGLQEGQIVTTGSLTGATRVDAPMRVQAELEGFGRIEIDVA
jgi:2-keto-4-pentenoate hydratase